VTVAALYVDPAGVYASIPEVEAWGIPERDARDYPGPWPVVAHPPCKRWGRWWYTDGSEAPGADGGLFAHALECVRRFGGVLEHPAHSHAWARFDLPAPLVGAGWTRTLFARDLWSCQIYQRNWGHRAEKSSWLLYSGATPPPDLGWREPEPPEAYLAQPGRCSTGNPRRTCRCDRCRVHFGPQWDPHAAVETLSPIEAAATPRAFADLLIRLATMTSSAECRARSAESRRIR
jgi:hypothetical protein